jgi:hypothetical protein
MVFPIGSPTAGPADTSAEPGGQKPGKSKRNPDDEQAD